MSLLFVIPLIIFMLLVAPLWLILHYRSQSKLPRELSEQQMTQLEALVNHASALNERVQNLEQLLDEHVPQWRAQ